MPFLIDYENVGNSGLHGAFSLWRRTGDGGYEIAAGIEDYGRQKSL